jgi:hypothetical protein
MNSCMYLIRSCVHAFMLEIQYRTWVS